MGTRHNGGSFLVDLLDKVSIVPVMDWTPIVSLGIDAGASPAAARKWHDRGVVPWAWRGEIAALAKERGLALTPEQKAALTTRKSPTASERSGQVGQQPLE